MLQGSRFGHLFSPKSFINIKIKQRCISVLLALFFLFMSVLPAAAAGSIKIFLDGQQQHFTPGPQIINGRVLVPMRAIFESLGAEVSWEETSRTAIAFKNGKYVSVKIGSRTASRADASIVSGQYQLSNVQTVQLDTAPIIASSRTMVPLRFISEALGANVQWVDNTRHVYINTNGVNSVTSMPSVTADQEMRGVWISFNSLANFNKANIDAILDKAVDMKLNTVVVHARAYSDAFYQSNLFPWSHLLTGVQGQASTVDPLQYVITGAHQRGLRVEAWINPYRISTSTTLTNTLAPGNPASKWINDPSKVIRYQASGQECLIYNPASQEVRDLITAGIVEIINNYDVDGIHFDDYFYVTGMKEAYDTATKKAEVNKLVRQVYHAVKSADPNLSFGISPAGNIANCNAAGADVQTWLSQDGYVDYVCPQIYWSNENSAIKYQFNNCLNDWLALKQNRRVKVYVGLALYRVCMTISGDPGWVNRNDNMITQVQRIRSTGKCAGFVLFDASNMMVQHTQPELSQLKSIL